MWVSTDVASAKRSNESARLMSKMLKLTARADIPRETAEMAITAVSIARWQVWNIVAVVRPIYKGLCPREEGWWWNEYERTSFDGRDPLFAVLELRHAVKARLVHAASGEVLG
jgi:hypothetical protein